MQMVGKDYKGTILIGEDLLRVEVSDPGAAAIHREDRPPN